MRYELSPEQYQSIIDASKPVPYIVAGGVGPITPQERANFEWARIGDEVGFNSRTVTGPKSGDAKTVFYAEPKPVADS